MNKNSIRTLLLGKTLYVANQNGFYQISLSDGSVKDDKPYNYDEFLTKLKNSKIIKDMTKKVLSTRLKLYVWDNYTDIDKKSMKDVFENLSFLVTDIVLINNLIRRSIPTLVISIDGIHYIHDSSIYYDYYSHGKNVCDLVKSIKINLNFSKYVQICANNIDYLKDKDALYYEEKSQIIEKILKI